MQGSLLWLGSASYNPGGLAEQSKFCRALSVCAPNAAWNAMPRKNKPKAKALGLFLGWGGRCGG